MQRDEDADDRAWRAIVENYGERAEIDEPAQRPEAGPAAGPAADAPFGGRFGDPRALGRDPLGEDADHPFTGEYADEPDEPDEEGYEPPPPPPLPRVTPDRMLAWIGIFGSPVVLLTALLFSITLPSWLGYLLIVGFVGGFVYLVARMSREPRDPFDDGAQI